MEFTAETFTKQVCNQLRHAQDHSGSGFPIAGHSNQCLNFSQHVERAKRNSKKTMSVCGVSRVSISELKSGLTDNLIVGIIIARQSPRKVKKEGLDGQRAVWDITLRDSPEDFINVTFWGTYPHLNGIADSYHIGDVVDIVNARINVRLSNDPFRPFVSSPFQLTISEASGKIAHHEGDDTAYFLELKYFPTKPVTNIFTLADIHSKGACIGNETVDLLVAVRSVEQIRNIMTKDKRNILSRVVIVMDYTRHELPFQIWNTDIIDLAKYWKIQDTVLFLADVRIEWNVYKRCFIASDRSTTIVIENPRTSEADALRSYAQNMPIQRELILDKLANSIDPGSVHQVMTIRQILDRSKVKGDGGEDNQFSALIYCLITHLDLDGSSLLVVNKCNSCGLSIEKDICTNPMCCGSSMQYVQTVFDLRVSLADHTGSLEYCRLGGSIAENVLGCTAKQFLSMDMDSKTKLKWAFLLERCSVRILVLRPSFCNPRPSFCLLSCSVSEPTEVANHIPLS